MKTSMWLYLNETYKKFNHESLQHWYLLINISCGHFQNFLLFFIPTFHCSLLNFFCSSSDFSFCSYGQVNKGEWRWWMCVDLYLILFSIRKCFCLFNYISLCIICLLRALFCKLRKFLILYLGFKSSRIIWFYC